MRGRISKAEGAMLATHELQAEGERVVDSREWRESMPSR